jgi:hypothetical protein
MKGHDLENETLVPVKTSDAFEISSDRFISKNTVR